MNPISCKKFQWHYSILTKCVRTLGNLYPANHLVFNEVLLDGNEQRCNVNVTYLLTNVTSLPVTLKECATLLSQPRQTSLMEGTS